jgi:hypothetical protein
MSPAARGAGHGEWWRSQGRTFAALTEAFTFGPTGVRTGTQRLSQEIELDQRGVEFQSRIASLVLDIAGQVTFAGCATSIGRRLD